MLQKEINNQSYKQFLNEKKLMGTRCRSCGELYLPPRPLCPACHQEDMEWHEFTGKGEIAAFTTVHIAPTAMIEAGYGRENPYCVGVVRVEEGPAISAQIIGFDSSNPQEIALGTAVAAGFIERGEEQDRQTTLVFERI